MDNQVVIVVEVDERCHSEYSVECKLSKVMQQSEAIQLSNGLNNVAVITLRLNPDNYHVGKVSLDERVTVVANRIKEIQEEFDNKKESASGTGYMRMEFFYYHERLYIYI